MHTPKLPMICFTALVLSIGLSVAALGDTNLVLNGSFELSTPGTGAAASGYGQPGFSGLILDDWTNTSTAGHLGYNFLFSPTNAETGVVGNGGTLALWGPGNGGVANNPANLGASPDGGNFMAFDGAYQQSELTQSISGLTIGDNYTLNFFYGGSQQTGFNGNTTQKFTVGFGGDSYDTPGLVNTSHSFTGWFSQSHTFTATSSTQVLSFLASGAPAVPPFALLDGVTLFDTTSSSTPEPGAFAAAFAGLIGLGVFAGRRGRTKTAS